MFIILFASLVGATVPLPATIQDVPRQAQSELPRPLLMDDTRPLPPQVIVPGRRVFSSDGATLGIVERVVPAGPDERVIHVSVPGGTVKAVMTNRWTVSDAGVVINLTKPEFDAAGSADITEADLPA